MSKIIIYLKAVGGGSLKHHKNRVNGRASILLHNYITHLNQEINFLTNERQVYLEELNKLKENK